MVLIALFRAEWRKQGRLGIGLVVLVPVFLTVLTGFAFHELTSRSPERASWSFFTQLSCAHWGVFLGNPLCILLAARSMVIDIPHLKCLAVQGRSLGLLYGVKTLVIFAMMSLSIFGLVAGLAVSGWILGLPLQLPWERMGLMLLTAPLALPVISFQLWLGLHRRHLLLLLLVPLFGHFVSLLALRTLPGRLLPWSYSLEFLKIRGQESWTQPTYFLTGLVVGLVFLTLGTRTFQRAVWN